jgi:RNA recognition motif-containing protein
MPSERRRMLFVGGIPPQITEELLQAHFKKFGRVHRVKIAIDKKTRESKGYAYITVADSRIIPSILKSQHVVLGRKLDVQFATSKGDKKQWQEDARQKRVFVTNLPPSTTVQDLEDAFSKFGKIHNAYIIYDYQKLAFKDYGYVQFIEASDAALAVHAHIRILGKGVLCQPYMNKNQQLEKSLGGMTQKKQQAKIDDLQNPQEPEVFSQRDDQSDSSVQEDCNHQQNQEKPQKIFISTETPHNTAVENSQLWRVQLESTLEAPCVVGQPCHQLDESIEPFEPRSFDYQHRCVETARKDSDNKQTKGTDTIYACSAARREVRSRSEFTLFGRYTATIKPRKSEQTDNSLDSLISPGVEATSTPSFPGMLNEQESNYRFNYNNEPVVFRSGHSGLSYPSIHRVEVFKQHEEPSIFRPKYEMQSCPQMWSIPGGHMIPISAAMITHVTVGCLQLIHQIASGAPQTTPEDLLSASLSKSNSTSDLPCYVFPRQVSNEKHQLSWHTLGGSRDHSSAILGSSSCGITTTPFTEHSAYRKL